MTRGVVPAGNKAHATPQTGRLLLHVCTTYNSAEAPRFFVACKTDAPSTGLERSPQKREVKKQ